MFAEHRAYKRLRKVSQTHAVTRYASAMYRTRLYSQYTTDVKLARQMHQQYIRLRETVLGQRILALGKRRSSSEQG